MDLNWPFVFTHLVVVKNLSRQQSTKMNVLLVCSIFCDMLGEFMILSTPRQRMNAKVRPKLDAKKSRALWTRALVLPSSSLSLSSSSFLHLEMELVRSRE